MLDRLAGHLLCGMYGIDDGGAGRLQIDDRPIPHSTRDLMTNDEAARVVVGDGRDKTTHVGLADTDASEQPAARSDRGPARVCPSASARWCSGRIPLAYRRFVHCAHVFFAGGRPFFGTGVSFGVSGLTRMTSRFV